MTTLHPYVPSPRSRTPARSTATIRRGRLNTLLDRTADPGAVTLVTAPAGYGKTTLLVDWIASRTSQTGPVAWLTAGAPDNDVVDFRTSIVTAFATANSPALSAAVSGLPTVDDPSYADFGTLLVDALESVDEDITLILDDSHLLHGRSVLADLGSYLRWPPRTVRTIVSGRFEPPLALQKLRLDGRVHDISTSIIAFDSDEAAEMLARSGTMLADDELARLMYRTEGWAAGLRLASMALAGAHRASDVVDAFTGSQHAVADYLVGEVLTHLAPGIRAFLVETSVPDWFTTDLAERLTGDLHAQDTIDSLLAQNFLVEQIPGPETAYRYHPLMREYLRAEIARLGAAQIRNLERVAASWFTDYRQPLQALTHSVHAEDCPSILAILADSGLSMVLQGQHAEVLAAVERSPASVREHTVARSISAAAYLVEGNAPPAVSILAGLRRATTASPGEPPDPRREILRSALEVHAALHTGDISGTLTRASRYELGKSGKADLDAYALMVVGLAEMHLGRTTNASNSFTDAAANAQAANLPLVALTCMASRAMALLLALHMDDAMTTARACRDHARQHDLTASPGYAVAQTVDALVAVLRTTGSAAPNDAWATLAACADPLMADYGRRVGWALQMHQDGAGRLMRECLAADRPVVPALEGLLAPMIQRRYLTLGQVHHASEIVGVTVRRLGKGGEAALLAAEIHRVHGRNDAADAELSAIIDGIKVCASPVTLVRALLASASIAWARTNPVRAFADVTRALALAEPASVLLPFAEAGAPVREILTHNHGRFAALEPFAELVRTVVPHDGTALDHRATGTLTRREMELLRELPSWRTAEQIAADHFVSVNTVKTHLRGIYRKLEVRSRRDAIAVAHELGLL